MEKKVRNRKSKWEKERKKERKEWYQFAKWQKRNSRKMGAISSGNQTAIMKSWMMNGFGSKQIWVQSDLITY